MKNFIFKSEADFHKIVFNKLDVILTEQRHQRTDLADITRLLRKYTTNDNLQQQVDKYFEDDSKDIPEVEEEPQTEIGDNDNPPG